jgi:hypothetical protein
MVFLVAIFSSGSLEVGEDPVEPIGLMVGLIFFPLFINICYTFQLHNS